MAPFASWGAFEIGGLHDGVFHRAFFLSVAGVVWDLTSSLPGFSKSIFFFLGLFPGL